MSVKRGGSGTTVNTYDDYGVPGSGNTGRFGYTGQTWVPELGMWYYKARMYSPTLGRFMQTDPIGYGDGMNIYAYVGNDPVNKVDYWGLCDNDQNEDKIFACRDLPDDDDTNIVDDYYDPIDGEDLLDAFRDDGDGEDEEGYGGGGEPHFIDPANTIIAIGLRTAPRPGIFYATKSWWDRLKISGYYEIVEIALYKLASMPSDRTTLSARDAGLPGGSGVFYHRYSIPGLPNNVEGLFKYARFYVGDKNGLIFLAPYHGFEGPGVPNGFISIVPELGN